MSYVQTQDLLAKTGSIYKLVTLAAKRAQELNAGAPRLVDSESKKVTTLALEEIAQGKIKLKTEK